MIYFIRQGTNGPIKIGFTTNPDQRLKDLQTASPYKLQIIYITDGNAAKEKRIQNRFKHLRLESEWFIPEKELLNYIAKLRYSEIPERLLETNHSDIDKCRMCGLTFCEYYHDDELEHIKRHAEIKKGKGIPFPLIEVMKNIGWAIIHKTLSDVWGKHYNEETGKRMVVFAWWMDARSRNLPDWDFEPFMAAHLDLVDAMADGDEEKLKRAEKATAKWH